MYRKLDNHSGYIEMLDERDAILDPIKWVTSAAAIARGKKQSSNAPIRYESLCKEAEGWNPSRPLEFLPLVYHTEEMEAIIASHENPRKIGRVMCKWGNWIESTDRFQTTARSIIAEGLPFPKNATPEDTKSYAIFRVKVPMWSWAQIITHTQLSTETQSDRSVVESEYWLPDDIMARIELLSIDEAPLLNSLKLFSEWGKEESPREGICEANRQLFPKTEDAFKKWMLSVASQEDVQLILKEMGYPLEVYSRAPGYFKMKEFVIGGFCNVDREWPHFLRERAAYMDDGGPKNHTQKETKEFAYQIRMILEESGKIGPMDVELREFNKKRKERGEEK